MLIHKKIIVSSFLLLALFLAGCSNQANSQNSIIKETASANQKEHQKEISKVDKIEIVDFHGTRRCYSCEIIEKFTKKTLEEYFQPELQNGVITFQSINGELVENRDIVIQYQARGSSLFFNVIRDGKDNIAEEVQVWRLVSNEQQFKAYLQNKIKNILN